MRLTELANLSRSSRQTVLAALVVIVAVAMYRWTISPQLTYLKAMQQYRPVIENAHRQTFTLQASLQTRRRLFEQLQQQLEALSPRFYSLNESGDLERQIMTMATAAGCSVTSMAIRHGPGPGQQKDLDQPVRRLDLDLVVVATYDSIVSLVKALQAHERGVYITSLSIGPSGADGSALQCRLAIAVYIRQQEGILHG